MKYVIFTEILTGADEGRWYYGTYATESIANEIAYSLGHDPKNGVYRSICPLDEAKAWGIKNMP